jgi:hypothetical protein
MAPSFVRVTRPQLFKILFILALNGSAYSARAMGCPEWLKRVLTLVSGPFADDREENLRTFLKRLRALEIAHGFTSSRESLAYLTKQFEKFSQKSERDFPDSWRLDFIEVLWALLEVDFRFLEHAFIQEEYQKLLSTLDHEFLGELKLTPFSITQYEKLRKSISKHNFEYGRLAKYLNGFYFPDSKGHFMATPFERQADGFFNHNVLSNKANDAIPSRYIVPQSKGTTQYRHLSFSKAVDLNLSSVINLQGHRIYIALHVREAESLLGPATLEQRTEDVILVGGKLLGTLPGVQGEETFLIFEGLSGQTFVIPKYPVLGKYFQYHLVTESRITSI